MNEPKTTGGSGRRARRDRVCEPARARRRPPLVRREGGGAHPDRVVPLPVVAALLAVLSLSMSCHRGDGKRDPLRIPWETRVAVRASSIVLPVKTTAAPSQQETTLGEEPNTGGQARAEAGARAADCRAAACHAELATSADIHSRVAAGSCIRCHVPDPLAKHSFRLVADDGGVCRSCHPWRQSSNFLHQPVKEWKCLSCHAAHGAASKSMLVDENPARSCGRCHEPSRGAVVHGPYAAGECLACHDPHESEHRSLTRVSSAELCLGCHDKEIVSADGLKHVDDIAAVIRSSPFKHGPIRAGECDGCHAAHVSPYRELLHKAFGEEFYQTYDESRYALCFQCHPNTLVLEERTTTLTKFRDGDRNLHYLHVRKGEKGRSCRACHEIHASSQPFHLRESVPYGTGNWTLPINFQQTPTGGACGPTCHKLAAYNNSP